MRLIRFLFLCVVLCVQVGPTPANAQGSLVVIRLLTREGAETTRMMDGNRVQLSVRLPAQVPAAVEAAFFLDGLDTAVATCSLAAGSDQCASELFSALGWYWGKGGVPQPSRAIHVRLGGQASEGALEITIKPRPVVLVHGFLSNWETWKAYLGPAGYLASLGLLGFAVGDGQAPGVMNTGDPSNPAGSTNSIAQNAEVLKGYIAAVQNRTGAEKVDLLVHSMGGMIARYYLDRIMDTDNVAQVIFLGTPMAGSACVFPVASLGFLMPASLEIMPDYMTNIFNRQIVHRQGVPFYMVAGTLLNDPVASPCADAPSDAVVGLDSATAVKMDNVQKLPLFHGSLTSDQKVFDSDVSHLLQSPPTAFAARPDLEASAVTTVPAQFSRAYSGHLKPGENTDVSINIDPNVSLANFSLYDSSRSLELEVRGANGNLITLDRTRNGSLKIDDPQTMLYLGYGFRQPKPGKWVVTLKTTGFTPTQGADYAINARFIGGATLIAASTPIIPAQGQVVTITARLQVAGTSQTVESAQALIRKPDGSQVSVALTAQTDGYSAGYQPDQAGLHSVEVSLTGKNAAGFSIERAAFLTFEVQPGSQASGVSRWLLVLAAALVLALLVLLVGLFWLIRRLRRPKSV